MYTPPAFTVPPEDPRLWALIQAYPFATVVAMPEIAHLPLLADSARGVLLGHVAARNPLVDLLDGESTFTAVFHGPHGYISPRWYRSAGQVPTWTYAVVHATGPARRLDRAETQGTLARLAATFEAGPRPWRLGEVPPADREEMLDEIVGFALEVRSLVGKFKLSQNRLPEDQAGVRAALAARDTEADRDLLRWMLP